MNSSAVLNNSSFNTCKNMIYSLVLERFKKMKHSRPDVSFEDLLSEGYYVYSWCLNNYTEKKNTKFTTYLYLQMRQRLLDYYFSTHKIFGLYEDVLINDKEKENHTYESAIVSKDYNISKTSEELIQEAKKELSYDAYQVFDYILGREWETKNNRKTVYKKQIIKHFGFPEDIGDSIWNELTNFWSKKALDYIEG